VQAYDPTVDATSRRELRGMRVCLDPYSACQGADVLALLTEWDEFRWLDFDKVSGALNRPHVVDGRNLLDRAALARRGFRYAGIGR
jgi:UDPglucose 6-dehydrogenase